MTIFEKFERQRLLKEVSTFKIGGPAHYFIEAHDLLTLKQALHFCRENGIPFFILGKGSNSLFDDRGFAGCVIANRLSFLDPLSEGTWRVGAGYSFSRLGTLTAREGWTGLEFASGIPASVGGAVYMNAGANGCETQDTLISVEYLTEEGELLSVSKDQLEFGYRFSSFQTNQHVIVSATFQLKKCQEARKKQLDIIEYRKQTQPYHVPSAGCVFRNPNCGHAGFLIEKCGLKGKSWGGAQVSALHANFIVNADSATSADVQALIAYVKQEVKKQTAIELESEVRYIPYLSNQE